MSTITAEIFWEWPPYIFSHPMMTSWNILCKSKNLLHSADFSLPFSSTSPPLPFIGRKFTWRLPQTEFCLASAAIKYSFSPLISSINRSLKWQKIMAQIKVRRKLSILIQTHNFLCTKNLVEYRWKSGFNQIDSDNFYFRKNWQKNWKWRMAWNASSRWHPIICSIRARIPRNCWKTRVRCSRKAKLRQHICECNWKGWWTNWLIWIHIN